MPGAAGAGRFHCQQTPKTEENGCKNPQTLFIFGVILDTDIWVFMDVFNAFALAHVILSFVITLLISAVLQGQEFHMN
jgi:hypothetical protein